MASDERWRIPDALWARIEPLLPPPKPHRFGGHRPRVDNRRAWEKTWERALDFPHLACAVVTHRMAGLQG